MITDIATWIGVMVFCSIGIGVIVLVNKVIPGSWNESGKTNEGMIKVVLGLTLPVLGWSFALGIFVGRVNAVEDKYKESSITIKESCQKIEYNANRLTKIEEQVPHILKLVEDTNNRLISIENKL